MDLILHSIILLICVCATVSSPYVNTRRQYGDTVSPGWKNKQADVYFVMDTSASIWIRDYRELNQLVSEMTAHMDLGPDKTRVGVGVFEEYFHPYISVDNNKAKAELVGLIQESPYIAGNGYLSVGIQGLRRFGLPSEKRRAGVPSIGVVFTDGVSRHKQLTLDNATLAKEEGIFLFMVGIGSDVDKGELYNMASDPKPVYYHYVSSFDELDDLKDKLMSNMAEVEYFQGDEGTCGDKVQVDTVFVYDDYSLGRDLSLQMSQFLKNAADRLSMGTGNVRLAAVATSERQKDFMLGDYVRREKLKAMLDRQEEEDTPLDDLVIRATTEAFLDKNGGRPGAVKRMVLLLDRKVTMSNRNLLMAVLRAKFDDIQVYVIQLGSNYDKSFAMKLATKPSWVFVDVPLQTLLKPKSEFFSKFCEDVHQARALPRAVSYTTSKNGGSSSIPSESRTHLLYCLLVCWWSFHYLSGQWSSQDNT